MDTLGHSGTVGYDRSSFLIAQDLRVSQKLQEIGHGLRLDAIIAADGVSPLQARTDEKIILTALGRAAAGRPIVEGSLLVTKEAARTIAAGPVLCGKTDPRSAFISMVDSRIDRQAYIWIAGSAHALNVVDARRHEIGLIKLCEHEEHRCSRC